MQLKTIQVFPVREIPEQIRRRIAFNSTTGALDTLADIVSSSGHEATGTVAYQSALADVVGFDSTPDGFERPLVNISGEENKVTPFSYGARDTGVYNFVIVLVASPINDTRSQEMRYIVTGYTSQAEPSFLGSLPDDMVLYINDIYGLQTTYTRNVFGEKVIDPNGYKLVDNYVLSKALALEGYHEASINAITVAKSADMVKKLQLSGTESIVPTEDTIFAPTATTAPTLLSGQLTRPEAFVTAISNSYLRTRGMEDELSVVESFFEGTGGSHVETELNQLGVVRQFASYELIKAFRTALSANTGDVAKGYKTSNGAFFRLADLRAALENADSMDAQIAASLSLAARRGLGEIDKTDDWVVGRGYSTMGSLVAYDLAMQLGAIMSRNLFGTVSFHYDNRHADFANPPTIHIHENSVSAISENQLPAILAQRFLHDLEAAFVRVSKHNQIRFAMNVTALLGSVVRVEVLVDGETQPEFKTYASFMSSRMHSGNTTSMKYAGELAVNTAKLLDAIDDGYHGFESAHNQNRLLSNIPKPTRVSENGLLDQFTGTLGSTNSLLG